VLSTVTFGQRVLAVRREIMAGEGREG